MATASSAPPGANDGMTPAQKLAAQHSAAQSHQPTVEDVADEDDPAGPPTQPNTAFPSSAQKIAVQEKAPPMSEKAAGKQKVSETPASSTNAKSVRQNAAAPLNTQSEEAFPSLAAPKSQSGSQTSRGKQPAMPGAQLNGGSTWSNSSSRSSTPVSSGGPTTMSFPGNRGQGMYIPGRQSHSITLNSSHLKPRSEMKKPIQETLRDLQRRSKATVDMKSAAGAVTFQAQGPTVDSVHQLLKDVVAQVGARQSVKIPVPLSVRAHIIGKQGAKIQEIEKKSGAKIRLAKQSAVAPDAEDDDDATVDVEIEGDAITAEAARREIEAIVGQRTSTVSTRMRHVPPEYYPFLAGAHNSRVNAFEEGRNVQVKIPHYHTWQAQPPPPRTHTHHPLPFTPQEGYNIHISGDRDAARQVQAEIEREVAELQSILYHDQTSIPRERHPFILGDRGNSLHDFLEETGCSVIMPPPSSDTEVLTIVGPKDQIENATNKVMDLAMSMQMQSLDIGRQHPQASGGGRPHSRDLMRYLQQRQAFQDLEQLHNANVVIPEEQGGPSAWQVFARDGRNAIKARTDLMNLVSAHPPARFRNLDLHPYHQHRLQRQNAQVVRDNYGVHLVFAEPELDDKQLLLVYEGPGSAEDYRFPTSRPSGEELARFEQALAEAEAYILGQAMDQSIVRQSVEAPIKYREKVQRFINRHDQDEANAVQFLGSDPRQARTPIKSAASFPVNFQGPSNAVEQCSSILQAFVDEQIRDEAERGYTTSFDFPQRFANQLIGQKGSNINKLRDEFDVDINVRGDKVEIKGPTAKANAAKAHIIFFAKRQEDEATHTLKIRNQFHRDLVGKDGNQVKRLQERYHVRVMFPRINAVPSPENQSLADGENEAAAIPKSRRSVQAPDEVVIRGPRRGADEAREELLSLYQYIQDNSHTSTISVSKDFVPGLIGQGGRDITNLRMTTGAQVDVPKTSDEGSGRVEIKIKGTKSQVENARTLIQQKSKLFDESIARTMRVDQKHHQALRGPKGETVRQLIVNAGGSDDPKEQGRLVRIPPKSAPEDVIRLEGHRDIVERLIESIQNFIDQRDKQVTEVVTVAPERHGLLIGKQGQTRTSLESEFNVTLDIPNQSVLGPERSVVRLSGEPADVERAKERILGMVKGQEGETVHVPQRLHHAVVDSSNPNIFRTLQRDLRVTVDHAGHPRPPRPEVGPPARSNGAAVAGLPLITDGEIDTSMHDVNEHHTWDVQSAVPTGDGEGANETIPWVLKGADAASIAEAKERLLQAVAAAENAHTGFLVLPDPGMNRYVIGERGSTINKIRRETECRVEVPQARGSREPIKIVGNKEAVEHAKQLVLEAVTAGGSGRR